MHKWYHHAAYVRVCIIMLPRYVCAVRLFSLHVECIPLLLILYPSSIAPYRRLWAACLPMPQSSFFSDAFCPLRQACMPSSPYPYPTVYITPSSADLPMGRYLHCWNSRVFAGNLVALGFLQSVSYIKPIMTHENLFAVGKSGPNATFNLPIFFWGLGWPWVGDVDGFILIFICFPTQHNLVYRKHPTQCRCQKCRCWKHLAESVPDMSHSVLAPSWLSSNRVWKDRPRGGVLRTPS